MHDVFFFTDIHGARPLFDAIMNYCNEQDPDAMIIFGGDACDRGKDGYAIMKELLDNPRVCYLKGNHEDMFCKAAHSIKEMFNLKDSSRKEIRQILNACRLFDEDRYMYIQHSLANDGLSTLTDWIMDGMPMHIIDKIEHLPLTFSYEQCDFCHSAGVYRTFKQVADAEYECMPIDNYAAEALIWGRSCLNIGWEPNRIAVFGHTPVQFLPEYTDIPLSEEKIPKPIMYSSDVYEDMSGKKLDMDTGATFIGVGYVLNVLTMRTQGFKFNENNGQVEQIECIQF